MQNSHKAVALALGVICASWGLTAAPVNAQTATAAKVIGVIDRDKVVTSYSKAQQAAEELKKSEDKVQKLVEDSNRQYEEAKKSNKPPAELEGLQKRLQTQIDDEVKRLQSRAQTLEGTLEHDIDAAIKAEAANHHVDIVLSKGVNVGPATMPVVLLGGVDITESVMKRLGAGGAAASAPAKSTTK